MERYFSGDVFCGYDANNKSIWHTFKVEWPQELLSLEHTRNNCPAHHGDEYSYFKIIVKHDTSEQRVKDIVNEWARFHHIAASDDPHKYSYTQIYDKHFRVIKTSDESDEYEFCVLSPYVD